MKNKWQNMSDDERELAYNPKTSVLDHEEYQNLATCSALKFRNSQQNKHLNIRYGKRKKQKLDIFLPKFPKHSPVQVYFHGGYWVSRDKYDHSHLALSSINNNIIHVSVNYDLCPDVPLNIIVEESLECINWVINNIRSYGGNPFNINLVGHSAGAHLVAMILNKHKTSIDFNINSAVLISGIYNPIITKYLKVNEKIKITEKVIKLTNVFNYNLSIRTNILVVIGELEPKEWAELSKEYIIWLKEYDIITSLYIAKGLNHFSIIKSLANPKSILSKKLINLAKNK